MTEKADKLVTLVAETLEISKQDLIHAGLRALLEQRLLDLNMRITEVTNRYGIASVAEMEAQYEAGTLAEDGTWEDFQRLDHWEYDRRTITQLLQDLMPSNSDMMLERVAA